ncbi:MAG: class I SAM-dependent methyltransferase [Pyrinomonadaceae bacterium]
MKKEIMNGALDDARTRVREIASEHYQRGDVLGWFEALYQEANGDNEIIPWADLEPNHYFCAWAESTGLKADGRTALVVGCGLGDDARYLHDLGFKVTAFDISPTAIEWAKKLHADTDIAFEVCDLFQPVRGWLGAFEFVLEVYTIQPLPLEMRPQVIDAIAGFLAPDGRLVVVTRGREDDVEPDELPWPMSRHDLSRFEKRGLTQTDFVEMPSLEEDEPPRFVVEYLRQNQVAADKRHYPKIALCPEKRSFRLPHTSSQSSKIDGSAIL